MMNGLRIKEAAEAIARSQYSMIAVGWRNIDLEELIDVLEIALLEQPSAIDGRLRELYDNHPETIAGNRADREMHCRRFNEQCDCYLPEVPYADCWCRRGLDKTARTTREYAAWRQAVLDRDGGACAACGTRTRGLVVHHIKSYREYPHLRLDVDNGQTLCPKCHGATRGMEGRISGKLVEA